jgi:hypothetical protein
MFSIAYSHLFKFHIPGLPRYSWAESGNDRDDLL